MKRYQIDMDGIIAESNSFSGLFIKYYFKKCKNWFLKNRYKVLGILLIVCGDLACVVFPEDFTAAFLLFVIGLVSFFGEEKG